MRPPLRSPLQIPPPRQPGWLAVARGAAFGMACLLTLNLLEILHFGSSSTENWFCSLQPLPETFSRVLLAMAVPSWLLYAVRRSIPGPVRNALLLISALLLAATARDFQSAFQSLPEPERISGCAQHLSVFLTLLVAAAGLLSNARIRAAGAAPAGPFLFAAAVTVVSFPLASIVSMATPRPLADVPCLCVLRTPAATRTGTSTSGTLATTAAQFHTAHPGSRFLVSVPAIADLAVPTPDSLRNALIAVGIPPKAILHLYADSDESLAKTLRQHPDLQPPSPRQLVFIAPAHELARLNLLARRSGQTPGCIPDAAAGAASPVATVLETWRLLQIMAAPAMDYFHSLRAPAETQVDFAPASDELMDPRQLIRELQESTAAEP
ncbi:MAG: hypothetical protein ACKO2P_17600 [Planctomycetota bacterium]